MSKSMYGTLSDKTVLPQPEPKQVRPRTTPSLPTVSPSRFVNGMYKTWLTAKNSYSPEANMDTFEAEYEAFVKKQMEERAARKAAEAAALAAKTEESESSKPIQYTETEVVTEEPADEVIEEGETVKSVSAGSVIETPVKHEVKREPAVLTEEFFHPSVEVEDKPDLGPVEVTVPTAPQPAEETTPKKKERKKKADAE